MMVYLLLGKVVREIEIEIEKIIILPQIYQGIPLGSVQN